MKKPRIILLISLSIMSLGFSNVVLSKDSFAQDTVMVGGAAMSSSKTIVDNIVNSADHTTLVTALKAAGLVKTLQGPGPFTVFAPTNEAFDKLPNGTLASLLKPENKAKLTSILTYHVVPGRLTAQDITAKANANQGKAILKTVQGETLTVMKNNSGAWLVVDGHGGQSQITIADVMQFNGVVHVVDTVLMP